jgi:peptidoglycan hydrolase CwlO-like protein
MEEPMSTLSPEKHNTHSDSIVIDDDIDMAFHDTPSSPFVAHIDIDDQENVAPDAAHTPIKSLVDLDPSVPQSAFKVSPDKKSVLRDRTSPMKTSPVKNLMDDFEGAGLKTNTASPKTSVSPVREATTERFGSPLSNTSRKSRSPSKSVHTSSPELTQRKLSLVDQAPEISVTPSKRPASSPLKTRVLRDNEGLTAAMNFMETHKESGGSVKRQSYHHTDFELDSGLDSTDMHPDPDGPEATSLDIDDTCFSTFSEMPGIDMTKFASLRKSPMKDDALDVRIQCALADTTLTILQATPRPRAQMTPSTVRRSERTPSPTPRRTYKDNDTTNLLLDFTAQIESFSTSRSSSSGRGQTSPNKSNKEPNLRSYYQSQRSPAKGGANVPATPNQSRQMLNLLDFELPPPPTPRSLPTVTIRELESVKSQFQSQISSLTASLSGKEAEIEALSRAISDAERRVGEAQEIVREERSAREYAETQMVDWKSKGEEVQRLLQDVQSEMARNDAEREELFARLAEAEKRAEEAENRSSELETKVIQAESKNVDMSTFISNDEGGEKKIYSELECQAAIAEKVNEVARDLHVAYKAKHEKKIKALKDNYQRKADERCKELKLQIVNLEKQVEEAEKKHDNTFSKIAPGQQDADENQRSSPSKPTRNAEDAQMLEAQRAEIENLKAKLAGLQSELKSLRKSHDALVDDLEAERIEKGELVAAAEQMLSMCGEKMEELQQEDLRRSQMKPETRAAPLQQPAPQQQSSYQQAPPQQQAMRNTGFLAGGPARPGSALGGGRPGSGMGDRLGAMNERGGSSNVGKPSGLRAPGGLKYQSSAGLNRSTSNGKSRLMSNIERMGGGKE